MYAVFKTVYLIILNEEKGGTCEAKSKLIEALKTVWNKWKLKDSMEAILMKS